MGLSRKIGALTSCAISLLTVGHASATLVLYDPFNYTAGQGLAGQDGQTGPTSPANNGGNTGGPSGTSSPWGQLAPNSVTGISTGIYWMTTGYSTAVTGMGTPYATYNHANDAVVNSNDLSLPGLYHQGSTNGITIGGSKTSPRIQFSPFANASDGSAVNAYYSFLFEIPTGGLNSTAAAGGVVAGFNDNRGSQQTNPGTLGAAMFVKPVKTAGVVTGFNVGVLKNGTGAANAKYDTTDTFNLNTVYLVVGRYTINGLASAQTSQTGTATDDTAQIWMNPLSSSYGADEGSLPTPTVVANTTGTGNVDMIVTNDGDNNGAIVQSLILRQDAAAGTDDPTTMYIDDLRIGSTFADVTPTPEPASMGLLVSAAALIASRRRRVG